MYLKLLLSRLGSKKFWYSFFHNSFFFLSSLSLKGFNVWPENLNESSNSSDVKAPSSFFASKSFQFLKFSTGSKAS